MLVWKEFDVLRTPGSLSAIQLKLILMHMNFYMGMSEVYLGKSDGAKLSTSEMYFSEQMKDAKHLTEARGRLEKRGITSSSLDKMSPLQILMANDSARYEESRDELMKWANLPFWQMPEHLKDTPTTTGILSTITLAFFKMREVETRLRQRVVMLQATEAIRAYAAEHGGTLPPSLEATALPIPVDPFSGKQLLYEVKDGIATLRGTPPSSKKADPTYNRVYTIGMRK